MKFFSLPNLSSQDVSETDPRTAKRPDFAEKAEFRAWCNDIKTQHCFYNHTEAITPSLRVTVNNEPFYLHGFTADYDAEIKQKEALLIITRNAPAGLLPRFISSTFSGGIRLTWEFEEPVLVDQGELSEKFMKLLVAELGAKNLAAGFDVASLKLGQYYEAGRNWNEIPNSKPISNKILQLIFFRAANQTTIKSEGPKIPIEKVAEQVEKLFPSRVKDFSVGQRVPLFWVEPFEPRVGAQIGDLGMLCYSTRAGKSFVPWSEILGTEFMRDYQAQRIGAAAEGLYFDGQHYWRKDFEFYWQKATKEDTIMWLKSQGVNPRPETKSYASEAERVLLVSQAQHRVKAAVPIVHNKNTIVVDESGSKFLNISTRKIMQPAEEDGSFNWIAKFFQNIWAKPTETQKDFFLAWLQHAYQSCLNGKPDQGQALFIAGPPSSGKTFMNYHILAKIFGGCADPSELLMGRTNFNKNESENYLWAIDDTRGAAMWDSKLKFGASIKKYVANPYVRCEGKGKDAAQISWNGRIVVTCNTDTRSLEIIPPLDEEGILDKISLFLWDGWKAPFLPNKGTETVVTKELPHFLRWLIGWKVPKECVSDNPRFAVNSYHHPDLLESTQDLSSGARLKDLLKHLLESQDGLGTGKQWMTPTKLRAWLSKVVGSGELVEFGKNRMKEGLEELKFKRRRNGTSTEYLVYDSDPEAGDKHLYE
jgi:hypothetical protein